MIPYHCFMETGKAAAFVCLFILSSVEKNKIHEVNKQIDGSNCHCCYSWISEVYFMQYAISEFASASLSKRVQVRNFSYGNYFQFQ